MMLKYVLIKKYEKFLRIFRISKPILKNPRKHPIFPKNPNPLLKIPKN